MLCVVSSAIQCRVVFGFEIQFHFFAAASVQCLLQGFFDYFFFRFLFCLVQFRFRFLTRSHERYMISVFFLVLSMLVLLYEIRYFFSSLVSHMLLHVYRLHTYLFRESFAKLASCRKKKQKQKKRINRIRPKSVKPWAKVCKEILNSKIIYYNFPLDSILLLLCAQHIDLMICVHKQAKPFKLTE